MLWTFEDSKLSTEKNKKTQNGFLMTLSMLTNHAFRVETVCTRLVKPSKDAKLSAAFWAMEDAEGSDGRSEVQKEWSQSMDLDHPR